MKDFGLSVATNFDDGLLDAFSGYPVTEVFGKLPSDAVGGGRASFTFPPLSRRRFERHVAKAKSKGIGFNYLLNPACMDNREFTRQGQREIEALLEYVEASGASAVTISLPSLLPVIKKRHPSLKVRVGVYARVDGVTKARFWEDGGADCITLESLSVNRDFGLLAALRKALKIELQLIVNANCQLFCPLSGQHMVNLSHASQEGHPSRGFLLDWCVMKCSYDKLRVRLSKLMKLKEVAARRGMLEPLEGEPVHIDNSELDGFIPGFQGRDCRSADCSACGWCASYARKAVRVDEVYRAELLKLYEEVFADMTSGEMWGFEERPRRQNRRRGSDTDSNGVLRHPRCGSPVDRLRRSRRIHESRLQLRANEPGHELQPDSATSRRARSSRARGFASCSRGSPCSGSCTTGGA